MEDVTRGKEYGTEDEWIQMSDDDVAIHLTVGWLCEASQAWPRSGQPDLVWLNRRELIFIRVDNIDGILKLANKYEMQNVKNECELFLRNDSGIDKKKRFKLVDEFGFEELKKEMLDSMKSLKDLQDVMTSNMENLDESTIRAIAEKLINEKF